MGITHVEATNQKLLDEIETALNKANRILAVTGAGISTNCGIPDFRSKDGLYSLINSAHDSKSSNKTASGHIKGKDLLSSTVWQDEYRASTFYQFTAGLRQKIKDVQHTSQTHKLLRRLRDQKKLLRCYTQNIDGLESQDGLCSDMSRGKGTRSRFTKKAMNLPNHRVHNKVGGRMDGGCEVVQLHGDLETTRCNVCSRIRPWSSKEQSVFLNGEAPVCEDCQTEDMIKQAIGKRRTAVGNLRPNIVLYGENNPMETEIGSLVSHDLTFGPDLLLIMGTSLKVHGLKTIVKEFAKSVHSKKNGKVIFINLSEPAGSVWKDVIDYWVEMDCDTWAKDKMRLQQSEIDFNPTKKNLQLEAIADKENVSKTSNKRKKSGKSGITTPPSTLKKSSVLTELDPVSVSRKALVKSGAVIPNIVSPSPTPSLSKRRKTLKFEIWDGNQEVAITLARAESEASFEASPSKGKKRKLT